jgi:hypothetical protein
MTVRPIGDLRRHVAHVSNAAAALLIVAQEAYEDIEGGIRSGQWELVAAQTRHFVLVCLHARGLAVDGEPHFWDDTTAGDLFVGVPDADVEAALQLITDVRGLPGTDPEPFLARVRAVQAAAEDSVQLAERLPELRSPTGMYSAVRLVRGWTPLVDELGLPSILPGEWTRPL